MGLDVHKDTIAAAVAPPGRGEPVYRGEIENQRKSLLRLIRSVSPNGELVDGSGPDSVAPGPSATALVQRSGRASGKAAGLAGRAAKPNP